MRGAGRSSALEQELDANDITLRAADRLEAALERLAAAFEAREKRLLEAAEQRLAEARATWQREAASGAGMVPRAEVEQLSARLDTTLSRLRAVLGDDAADL